MYYTVFPLEVMEMGKIPRIEKMYLFASIIFIYTYVFQMQIDSLG